MKMNIGDKVKVLRCDKCEAVVNRVVRIKGTNDNGMFRLDFGRGRPNKGRPEYFDENDLELVEEE